MASSIIDLGSLSINVTREHYELFFNQQAKQETKKNRAVFKTDYQRFIWAFVLGIKSGKRVELDKQKESSFKWSNIPADSRSLIMGLTIQELYKDNPKKLKEDLESKGSDGLSAYIRKCIEEYANAGFYEIRKKTIYNEFYIEDFEAVVTDILNNGEV